MRTSHDSLIISAPKQLVLPFLEPAQDSAKVFEKRRKLQISSIPGILPSERKRYRVTLGGEILGEFLSLEQAIELAKFFHKQKRLTDCLELLTQCGLHGDEAIFILSNLGGG